MDPLQDQEKCDFAAIYYTLARSDVSKKSPFWVPFWDHLGDKIDKIGFQMGGEKSSENIPPTLVIFGSILGRRKQTHFIFKHRIYSLGSSYLRVKIVRFI